MARHGDIPSRLQHCESPLCGTYQYGKATRKPRRTKQKNQKVKETTFAGECVSIDQSPARAVGFVAQMKGRLTHERYTVATIFVDHYSRLGYVHLQKDASSAETLKAKRAFKLYARERGITIRYYHADNGRFVDNAWKNAFLEENQGITYYGVNVHWQNGIAERRIRDLKEQSRTMLLHAEHHSPDALCTSLWPYAMRTACQVFNDAPTLKGDHKERTPEEVFSGTSISAEVRHHHTFGCLAYVTANAIQLGKSLPTWMSRARVSVFIGISPTHARSVSLILSLKTGLTSPQFHVKHDDYFETTDSRAGRYGLPRSKCQELAGLTKKVALPTKEKAHAQPGVHTGSRNDKSRDKGAPATTQVDAGSAAHNNPQRESADKSLGGDPDETDDDETVVLEGEKGADSALGCATDYQIRKTRATNYQNEGEYAARREEVGFMDGERAMATRAITRGRNLRSFCHYRIRYTG
jgi:hypothetical protein